MQIERIEQIELNRCRPKVILKLLEDAFPETNVSAEFILPSSKIGSLRLIESALLVALSKILNAKVMFEFGTFMGATSVLLAKNSGNDARVYTIDISSEELSSLNAAQATKAQIVDEQLRHESVYQPAKCINQCDVTTQKKITRLLLNSHCFAPGDYGLVSQCDLIFIDGGHDKITIDFDTNNAFAMRSSTGAIIWHDYNSPVFSEVTDYLNKHPMKEEFVFIEDTQMTIYWPALTQLM